MSEPSKDSIRVHKVPSPEVQAIKALCGEHPEGHKPGCDMCKVRAEAAAAYLVNQISATIKSLDEPSD